MRFTLYNISSHRRVLSLVEEDIFPCPLCVDRFAWQINRVNYKVKKEASTTATFNTTDMQEYT